MYDIHYESCKDKNEIFVHIEKKPRGIILRAINIEGWRSKRDFEWTASTPAEKHIIYKLANCFAGKKGDEFVDSLTRAKILIDILRDKETFCKTLRPNQLVLVAYGSTGAQTAKFLGMTKGNNKVKVHKYVASTKKWNKNPSYITASEVIETL